MPAIREGPPQRSWLRDMAAEPRLPADDDGLPLRGEERGDGPAPIELYDDARIAAFLAEDEPAPDLAARLDAAVLYVVKHDRGGRDRLRSWCGGTGALRCGPRHDGRASVAGGARMTTSNGSLRIGTAMVEQTPLPGHCPRTSHTTAGS